MAATKNRGLGRGLESLFSDSLVEVPTSPEVKKDSDGVADSVRYLSINDIKPNIKQPRKHFAEEKIAELANSIETHGIIQPILVRPTEHGYEIIAGERRWRAARRAGLREVPCIIRELDEQQNMLFAIIENMQREDLNPIEEALAYESLSREYGLTQEQISLSVGKSRPYITNALRLLKLQEAIRQMVVEGHLTSGHARALAGLKDETRQLSLAKLIVEKGYSVREAEAAANEVAHPTNQKKKKARPKNREIIFLEQELKEILGTKVNVILGSKRGKIELEYYSRDEMERLIDLIRKLGH